MKFLSDLKTIKFLQQKIKERSMTYQRSAKEKVAKHYNLPFEQVDLPFDQWMELWDKYVQDTKEKS